MKNAIHFVFFQILITAIYVISLYSGDKSADKPESLNTFGVNKFNYLTTTDKGDEIFLEGEHLTKNSTIRVVAPRGYVKLAGQGDKLFFTGNSLEVVDNRLIVLKGNSELKVNTSTLVTDTIKLDAEKKTVMSDTVTRVKSPYADFTGNSFIYDYETKNLRVNKVEGKIWLKAS